MAMLPLIDGLYDAALAPELWPTVLGEISAHLGAAGSTIVPVSRGFATLASRGCDEALVAYRDHWWAHDTLTRVAMRRRLDGFIPDWTVVDPDDMGRDAFYQDFRRPFGLGHCLAFIDRGGTPDATAFSVHMPTGWRGDLDRQGEIACLGRHIGRAATLMRLLGAADAAREALADVLDALPYGVALLGPTGEVLFANGALGALAGDGLRVERRRLRAAAPRSQAALDRAIALAGAPPPAPPPPLLALPRPSGRRPLLVGAMGLGRRGRGELALGRLGAARILAFALDGEAELTARSAPRLAAFGLTPAEARLAALIGAGRSPADAARGLGLTENTVRTTLKRVFEKMALSRQGELAHLVGRLDALP